MGFYKKGDIQTKELFPGCLAKLVHTEKMTISQVTLEAGALLPEHSHHHEQVSNVMEGEFEFTVDGATLVMGPGDVGVIPPNAVHSGKALSRCFIIDVFCPVREDYR